MKEKKVTDKAVEFLEAVHGEYLHPLVVAYGIKENPETTRWALECMAEKGKLKRKQKFGIWGKVEWHYASKK